MQMDKMWATNKNTEKHSTCHRSRSILDFLISAFRLAWEHRNGTGQMQICEDIFISHMEQGQMDVKNVPWLIWKEHAILREDIWAITLFCRIEGKNSKLSHPA